MDLIKYVQESNSLFVEKRFSYKSDRGTVTQLRRSHLMTVKAVIGTQVFMNCKFHTVRVPMLRR
jgi:hypothetical protein